MLKLVLEIKNRFFLLLLTWVSVFIIFYLYKEVFLFLITRSHILYTQNDTSLSMFYFIFTDVTEVFSIYLKIPLFLSFQIICFYSIYHLFYFFVPAMFNFEYQFILKGLQVLLSVWFLSIISVNSFIVPLTWNFFLSFPSLASNYSINLYFEARISEYLSFYIETYYICICYLQLFTVLILFFSYNKISILYIRKYRRLYYYIFVVLSTLLSPPDVLSQIIISFFIICLYEILLVNILFRKFI